MANSERTSNLIVRAQDQFSGVLNNLKRMQQEVVAGSAAAMRKAAIESKNARAQMERDIQATRTTIKDLTAEFDRLSRAEGDNRSEIARVVVEKMKLRGAARDLQNALQGVAVSTRDVQTAQAGGFKAFNASAVAMEREAAAYAKRERETAKMAEIQGRLNNQVKSGFGDWSRYADQISRIAAAEERSTAIVARKTAIRARLNAEVKSGFAAWSRSTAALNGETAAANATATALRKVELATKGAAAAQTRLSVSAASGARRSRGDSGGRKGESQDVEMYGLKPYQMVNLGYQVNDVISGLAMGQAPLQILSQQAGQFAQIWPNVMVSLVRSIPVIAATTAILAPFIGAIVEVVSKRKAIEEFDRRLRTMADGAGYSAEKLQEITRSFAELQPMIERGFSEESMKGFHTLAKTLSNANGKSVAENVQDLATAFGGGVEGVRNLDKELNFLTADQLKQIRAMEAQGDTAGALKVAQDALSSSYEGFSSKARGPWGKAVESLGGAWKNLMKWMSDTLVIRVTIGAFDMLGASVQWISSKIKQLSDLLPEVESSTPVDTVGRQIEVLKTELARLEDWKKNSGGALPSGFDEAFLDDLRRQISEAETLQKGLTDQKKAGLATTEQERQTNEAIGKLVDDQIHALTEEARLAKMTERARFQELEVLKLRNKALEEGRKLADGEIARIKEAAGLTFDASQSGVSNNLIDKIIGVESRGVSDAKNPNSSATGSGQFIASTWLAMFRKYYPAEAARLGETAILELRKDAALSRSMVELYAAENKKNLERFGVVVTDASVYLSHFLGPDGAAKLLRAASSTPVDKILGADQIAANKSILQGKTAGQVSSWAQQKMGISSEELAGANRLGEIDRQRTETAKNYNEAYGERIAQQQFELDMLTKSARVAAISKALRDEELTAQKANTTLTAERRAEVERLAAATFDNANAETRVNELMQQRTMLVESLQLAQAAGDESSVQNIIGQIGSTEEELNKAIDAAIRFYQAMGGPEADAAILKLQNMKGAVGNVVRDMQTKYLPTAEELNKQIADIGGDAFSAFAEGISKGENAFDAFKNSMVQGLGEMVIAIGKAIVQQAILNALTGGGANPGGGAGGTISGLIASIFHGGGIAGQPSKAGTRMVNPSIFAGAKRFHTGGVPALGPNEVPIIAMKDEEIITRDDPRHVMNGGASGGGSMNVKNVNVFNPTDVLEAALESEMGEKVVINWMTRRARSINGALAV